MLGFEGGARREFRPAPVLLAWLGSMALLLAGLLRSPYPYSDPRFAVDYLGTELLVAAFLAIVTALFLPAARIGWRRPVPDRPGLLLPFGIVLALAFAHWLVCRIQLPAPLPADAPAAWALLRTTLVVGLTEEWMYRGVLFGALGAWFGLRRGAVFSILAFGALHLLNAAGGQTPVQVGLQFVMAALSGASLLLVALGTRSLPVAMVMHGLYDFFVLDAARLPQGSVAQGLMAALLVAGPLAGLYSLVRVSRMSGGEPYPVSRR